MRESCYSGKFKRDVKAAKKRGKDMARLNTLIAPFERMTAGSCPCAQQNRRAATTQTVLLTHRGGAFGLSLPCVRSGFVDVVQYNA